MFFYLSKILWFFTAPSNLIVGALTLGTLLALWPRFSRFGRRLAAAGAVAFIIFGTGPVGAMLGGALERRFAPVHPTRRCPPMSTGSSCLAEPSGKWRWRPACGRSP